MNHAYMITYLKCRVVDIFVENSIEISEEPVFRSVVTTVAKIEPADESCYFPVVSIRMGVHDNTFLMVREQSSDDLYIKKLSSIVSIN